jgi:uncharacterized protein (DUF1330 family)
MPKGYAIFTETINDQAGYDGYVGKALPTILTKGGSAIVVHDNPEVLEGNWHGTRTVILEFESVEKAREWYNSPEYQAVVGERHASADANAAIVGGFEMPGSS